ncbi:MAG: hypothetical protein K2X38_00655 [Gemmataceae bacterium]|nr:hypothetical protein [Gemmataceae bacterium]
MSSFVARIDDVPALLGSWEQMLKEASGSQEFTANEEAIATLDQWPRIKWLYYCDDQDGNTLRIYDAEHLDHFGGCYYLELDGYRKEHFERVVIRGRKMWSGDQAALNKPASLRNRFRNNPAWKLYSARQSPMRPGTQPPSELKMQVKRANPSTVDIQAGMLRERRLWYFESVNQLPPFDPQQSVRQPQPTTPTSLFERLRAMRAVASGGEPKN